MHYLLIGYMFLFVHRPFEIWPILGEIRLERVYMLVTLLVWALYPDKRWLNNPLHAAFAAFGMAVLLCWGMSPWMDEGQLVVENWFKIAVFYVLLVTTIHDERRLRLMVLAFLGVMALYLTHSFREYLGGRHTYRMGTVRMIGVDSSMGDPNTFGSSILYALPLVSIFWHKARGWFKGALLAYVGLSILCLLLTGSRGSLLGLLILGLLTVWQTRSRFAWIALAAVALPVGFMALPENLQNRFETIVNPEAGPQTAQDSGHGRIEGLVLGLKTWGDNPITGVGPGAWRPATGRDRFDGRSAQPVRADRRRDGHARVDDLRRRGVLALAQPPADQADEPITPTGFGRFLAEAGPGAERVTVHAAADGQRRAQPVPLQLVVVRGVRDHRRTVHARAPGTRRHRALFRARAEAPIAALPAGAKSAVIFPG